MHIIMMRRIRQTCWHLFSRRVSDEMMNPGSDSLRETSYCKKSERLHYQLIG